jgi:predicted phosphodiesterase
MRYAILGDIRKNLVAFEAVLGDMEARGRNDEIWCLGDVVGYGPEPHACIEFLRRYNHIYVAGNHDRAAVGKADTSDFNPDAARACQWTSKQPSKDEVAHLQNLPDKLTLGDFTLVHGSPRQPIWEYLLPVDKACNTSGCFDTKFCVIGHSRIPLVLSQDRADNCISARMLGEVKLSSGNRRLIISRGDVE